MEREKSLKACWIEQIDGTNPGQVYITPKQLAGIIDTSASKIYEAINAGRINDVIKMGPAGTRCELRIPKWSAIQYIESFDV